VNNMWNQTLYFIHYSLLLLFGIVISSVFSGIQLTFKNILKIFALFTFCGLMQLVFFLRFGEHFIWTVYPLIVHLPTLLFLCILYKKRLSIVLASITTAYICCQPSRWFGILAESFTEQYIIIQLVKITVLFVVAFIAIKYLAPCISKIYQKNNSSVFIFGMIPIVYYVFDYTMSIYTDFWTENNRIAVEFLPFILCIAYMVFCMVYFRAYEEKSDAEHKEYLIQLSLTQQAKELEALKRSEQEIRLIRHDMRHFLNNLAVCLDEKDISSAQKMISGFTSNIDASAYYRFCNYATINYVLSDFSSKCAALHIRFEPVVNVHTFSVDEVLFSTILSNALENALQAQQELPEEERYIKFLLKNSDGKLLLSIKNPVKTIPVFVDGIPITRKPGHGYGTQSIQFATERLGGNYKFSMENKVFVLRVIL